MDKTHTPLHREREMKTIEKAKLVCEKVRREGCVGCLWGSLCDGDTMVPPYDWDLAGLAEKGPPKVDRVLDAPAANTLLACIEELKFGRPAEEQFVLDEAVNFIRGRLGNDGPGFPPEIVGEVFNGCE